MDITAETLYTIEKQDGERHGFGSFPQKARYIFFTDKLLEKMKEDEILAIFAHEVAHIRHRHLFKMLLSGILWICVIQIILYLMDFNAYYDALDESLKMWAPGLIGGVNVWLAHVSVSCYPYRDVTNTKQMLPRQDGWGRRMLQPGPLPPASTE